MHPLNSSQVWQLEEHVLDTWTSPLMHLSLMLGLFLPFVSTDCDSATVVPPVEPVKFSTEKQEKVEIGLYICISEQFSMSLILFIIYIFLYISNTVSNGEPLVQEALISPRRKPKVQDQTHFFIFSAFQNSVRYTRPPSQFKSKIKLYRTCTSHHHHHTRNTYDQELNGLLPLPWADRQRPEVLKEHAGVQET